MPEHDKQSTDDQNEKGKVRDRYPGYAISGHEGPGNHGDSCYVDDSGEDIDGEEYPYIDPALPQVSRKQAFACCRSVGLPIQKKRQFEQIGQEDQAH